MMRQRRAMPQFVALQLLLAFSGYAAAQQFYPGRPVRMIVPFAPGGGTDITGRLVAQKLSESWNVPVVIDNRPGAGSTVGEDMVAKACSLFEELRTVASVEYDDSGAIGRRYRRQDEIGTPFALTIDEQTLEDETITIRDRDSLAQERIPLGGTRAFLLDRLTQPWRSPKTD